MEEDEAMSLYWYMACDDCKKKFFLGSGHASGNFHTDNENLKLMLNHAGHKLRIVCDPDGYEDPPIFDYEEEPPSITE